MKVIGITGPTGAGKTTALNALRSLGGQIIDADAVYSRSDPVLSPPCGRSWRPGLARCTTGKPWTGRSWARWSFRTRRPWRT
ncbi:MAG: dephospho-CoA kinase [Evtepia gabavorous]